MEYTGPVGRVFITSSVLIDVRRVYCTHCLPRNPSIGPPTDDFAGPTNQTKHGGFDVNLPIDTCVGYPTYLVHATVTTKYKITFPAFPKSSSLTESLLRCPSMNKGLIIHSKDSSLFHPSHLPTVLVDRPKTSMSANWSTPTPSSDSTSSIPTCNFKHLEKSSLSISIPSTAHCVGCKYESSTASFSSTANSSDVFLGQPLARTASPPPPSKSWQQEVAFIFITCIAQFLSLSALNQTVSPVMILAKYFKVEDYGNLSWFSASYSMSVGTFILPAGTCRPLLANRS